MQARSFLPETLPPAVSASLPSAPMRLKSPPKSARRTSERGDPNSIPSSKPGVLEEGDCSHSSDQGTRLRSQATDVPQGAIPAFRERHAQLALRELAALGARYGRAGGPDDRSPAEHLY